MGTQIGWLSILPKFVSLSIKHLISSINLVNKWLYWFTRSFTLAQQVTLHLSSNIFLFSLQTRRSSANSIILDIPQYISFLSTNQLNTSVIVLTLMLLRFGLTCLLAFALLHHWCVTGSWHIILERTIFLSNLHMPVVLPGADPAIFLIHGFE